jgi:hypothetical protein
MIELVSDNPDPNRERERAKRHLDYTLRDLAANIMRVCAGAGRPENIPGQVVELSGALQGAYREKISAIEINTGVIPHALRVHENPLYPSYLEDNITLEERHRRRRVRGIAEAEEHIIKGALRVAAARLTENATQKSKSYDEMFEAMRKREEASNEKFDTKKEAKMTASPWGKPQAIIPQEPNPIPAAPQLRSPARETREDQARRLDLALALRAAETRMKAFAKRQRRPDGSRPSLYELRETEPEPVRLEFAELQKEVEKAKAELDHFDQTGEQRR